MDIVSCIDRMIRLEIQGIVLLEKGGWTPYKTKKAKTKFLNKHFDDLKIKKLENLQLNFN